MRMMPWSSARGRTGWPPPSRWRAPGARCCCSKRARPSAAATRSAELTLPGFVHDICSAIHPLALGSPFFRALPLARYGLEWIQPPAAAGPPARRRHGGRARALASTPPPRPSAGTARPTGRLMAPLAHDWARIAGSILGPLRLPRHPLALARFGLLALLPARGCWPSALFRERAGARPVRRAGRALDPAAGAAGHRRVRAGAGAAGPRRRLADAARRLAADRRCPGRLPARPGRRDPHRRPGGARWTTCRPRAPCCSTSRPGRCCAIAATGCPPGYRRQLRRYRYGPGVFKVDCALDGPIPWRSPECARAGTVHLGGTLAGDRRRRSGARGAGRAPGAALRAAGPAQPVRPHPRPGGQAHRLGLLPRAQRLDRGHDRAHRGADRALRARLPRPHPGPAHVHHRGACERYNANYIGGDINGGVPTCASSSPGPRPRLRPYRTPARGVYLCSSSTPPGGGVHGMCGYFAAQAALRQVL